MFLVGLILLGCQKDPFADMQAKDAAEETITAVYECSSLPPFQKSFQEEQIDILLPTSVGNSRSTQIDIDNDGKADVVFVMVSTISENKNNQVLRLDFLNKDWQAHYDVIIDTLTFCDQIMDGYTQVTYRPGQQNLSCNNFPYAEAQKNTYLATVKDWPLKGNPRWTSQSTLLASVVNEYHAQDYYYRSYHNGPWFGESSHLVFRKPSGETFKYYFIDLCVNAVSTQTGDAPKRFEITQASFSKKGLLPSP